MSPAALLGDRVPSCMLYSMVECRAWGSRTHPWPCRAMPGNSVLPKGKGGMYLPNIAGLSLEVSHSLMRANFLKAG